MNGKQKLENKNMMKTLKIAFVGLCLLLSCQLQAQVTNGSQTEELKTKILSELRNEKLYYFFMEKVIPKEQTKGVFSDTVHRTFRMYANKKHKGFPGKYAGSIDAIFFAHDTLCFNVDEYIIDSYPTYSPNDHGQPKEGKLEAKTIYVPIGLKNLSYKHTDGELGGRDDIYLMNIQMYYDCSEFNYDKGKTERVNHAKTLYNLLLTFQKNVELQFFDKAIEIFKTEVNQYNEQGEKASITEEQRKYIVQANSKNEKKEYQEALEYYQKAINVNPFSYPSAYNNMGLIAAQIKDYRYAIFNMKKYLMLVPEAEDARSAKDKIYEWEAELEK